MSEGTLAGGLLGLASAGGLLLILVSLTSPPSSRHPREGRMRRLAREAGVPTVTPLGLWAVGTAVALGVGCTTLLITAVPVVALMAALGSAVLPLAVLRRRARQRTRAARTAWPEAVDALASGVRAGLSLPEALGSLAQRGPTVLQPAFAGFAAEYHARGSFGQALDSLQVELADPVADRVVAALRVARDVGGSDLGRVLRELSVVLREDARTRGEIEARQSWTVSAARLAVAAPWLTLALLCTRPGAVDAYRTSTGAVVLVAAAVMSLVAYRVMMRIGRLPGEPRLVG